MESQILPFSFCLIDEEQSAISFTIQNGPVKEVGVNGCQVDTIIEAAKIMLESFNSKLPNEWNTTAIQGLETALEALKQRTLERERRHVEGTSIS